jgi:hypothetical protein
LAARRWDCGGAVLGPSCGTAALGHRGELREAAEAERKRERTAGLRKGEKGGLGVRVTTDPELPAVVTASS